jgi:DnaJ-domain-containing protein 1
MATGPLSIKLRCASWQQLAIIYKRDLSRGTMFLKASAPPPIGTIVRIDLTLPSGSVVLITGAVQGHATDPQRGGGVELKLQPMAPGATWMIESALAAEVNSANKPSASTSGPLPVDGDDVGAAEQELIKALVAEAESLKNLNPFHVLGVSYESTDSQVRAAFGELTKRYHPDRFARYESTELKQVAAEIFILIRDAYRKLADTTQRGQALAAIGRMPTARPVVGRTPTPNPPPPPRPSPNVRPRSVEIQPMAGTARGLDQAHVPTVRRPLEPPPPSGPPERRSREAQNDSFERAALETERKPMLATPPPVLTNAPDGSTAEQLLAAGRLDEALAAYKVMTKKHPEDRSVRAGIELCEGLRALAARDRLEAAQRFEAALEIDPSNEHAARELADMRRQATNERKGLLSRLMGKDS